MYSNIYTYILIVFMYAKVETIAIYNNFPNTIAICNAEVMHSIVRYCKVGKFGEFGKSCVVHQTKAIQTFPLALKIGILA